MTQQPRLALGYDEGSPERAVAAVIDLYDEGVRNGNPEPLRRAFDESAWMHGHVEGSDLPDKDLHWPIARFFDRAATFGRGWDTEDRFRSVITTLVVSGEAAIVGLRETDGRGGQDYDDFFTLFRFGDEWRITSKVFTQLSRRPAAG